MRDPYKKARDPMTGKMRLEHRIIMEKKLGRTLMRNEYVHHINHDKRDNRAENLELMTPQAHNELHKTYLPKTKICKVCGREFVPPTKHRKRNCICSKECWAIWQKTNSQKRRREICQYDLRGKCIARYNSIKEAAIAVNGQATNIVKCAKQKIKTAYGYIWRYSGKCSMLIGKRR